MKINNVRREKGRSSNRYCGPAVLSIVTGYDTADTSAILRHLGNVRKITGTSDDLLLKGLKAFGIDALCTFNQAGLSAKKRITLAAWLRRSKKHRTAGRVYLISAGRHWQIVSGRRYVCGVVGEVVSIKDKQVKRRSRVRRVWELTGNVSTPDCLTVIAADRANRKTKANSQASIRRQAKKIEAAEEYLKRSIELFGKDEDE